MDFYQPIVQTTFKTGYGINNHLQTIKALIEKCIEHNRFLFVAFVDYEKAFDSGELDVILEVLKQLKQYRVDYGYTSLI